MEELSEFNKKLMTAIGKKGVIETHKTPYISINKLAEYMTADAIRRRQIISALKKDKDFTKNRYSEMKNILPSFFKSGYDISIAETCITKIEKKKAISEFDKQDNPNTILALECLIDTELPDLFSYTMDRKMFDLKSIKLAGLDVTIKPELYFKHNETGKVGALKVHYAKTADNRLEEQNRIFAATLLKYAFIEHGVPEKEVDIKACISLDVFLKGYSTASTSYKQKIYAMEAACEEILLRWDNV